jgi:hypothetical protein
MYQIKKLFTRSTCFVNPKKIFIPSNEKYPGASIHFHRVSQADTVNSGNMNDLPLDPKFEGLNPAKDDGF